MSLLIVKIVAVEAVVVVAVVVVAVVVVAVVVVAVVVVAVVVVAVVAAIPAVTVMAVEAVVAVRIFPWLFETDVIFETVLEVIIEATKSVAVAVVVISKVADPMLGATVAVVVMEHRWTLAERYCEGNESNKRF